MQAHPHQGNRLLAHLPADEYDRLQPNLERVHLNLGSVIYESGTSLTHVYFPIDCIVSLLYVMADGDSAEIAIVGNEGIVGTSLFMGGLTTTSRAIVQNAGDAYVLRSAQLTDEFQRAGAVQKLLLLYTQALMTQMMQTGACNRHHSVDQQLCRWLLMSIDRLPVNRVMMTEGLIANMLGVRRQGVTDATGVLEDAGLITYAAGKITVLDRRALEGHACECYRVVKDEYDRLMPEASAT